MHHFQQALGTAALGGAAAAAGWGKGRSGGEVVGPWLEERTASEQGGKRGCWCRAAAAAAAVATDCWRRPVVAVEKDKLKPTRILFIL